MNIFHQRLEHPNERIADYYRDYCKTMAIIQQLSSPNTPKHNGLSERNARTIMDVVRCMLNRAALSKARRGEMAATIVFLLNRPPSKTIGGDTSYHRKFGKHVDLFFLIIGTGPHRDRQAHLAPTSRPTRSPHHLMSKQQLQAHWLQRRFIQHRQPGEGEVYIKEHALSLFGIIHSNARIFCDNKRALLLARQGSYSSRSRHLAIRFMGLRNRIVDEKIDIVHVSIMDQLSVTYRLWSSFWMNR